MQLIYNAFCFLSRTTLLVVNQTYSLVLEFFIILCPQLQIIGMVLKTPLHSQKLDTHNKTKFSR